MANPESEVTTLVPQHRVVPVVSPHHLTTQAVAEDGVIRGFSKEEWKDSDINMYIHPSSYIHGNRNVADIEGKAENAQSTTGGFLSLQQQKGIAGSHFEQRAVNINGEGGPPPSAATCETEDHGFANHKPGSAGGLLGTSTVKHSIKDTCVLPSH